MSKSNQQQMFDSILQWQQSGLSQKAWCEKNNVSYSCFHYWYRRLRKQHPGKSKALPEGFVRVVVQDPSSPAPWCELLFENGRKLSFHQPLPAAFIKSLLD